jgi:hypothetical protein
VTTALAPTRDLIAILSDAGRLYRQHFLIPVSLAFLGSLFALPVALSHGHTRFVLGNVVSIPAFLVGAFSTGAMMRCVADAEFRTPTFNRSLRAATARLPEIVTTSLLSVAMFVLTIPLFPWFWVRWAFMLQEVMLDDESNWDALGSSAQLVNGRWWRTARSLFVIYSVPMFWLLVSLPLWGVGARENLSAQLERIVAFTLLHPLIVAAATLLYFDLKAQRQQNDPQPMPRPA